MTFYQLGTLAFLMEFAVFSQIHLKFGFQWFFDMSFKLISGKISLSLFLSALSNLFNRFPYMPLLILFSTFESLIQTEM